MVTLGLVFLLGCLWGLHFSLIKICSESGLAPAAVTFYTTLGVSALFLIISALRRQLPYFQRKHIIFYALCSVFGYLLAIFIELLVAQYMDAGLLTLIVSTTPLFTLVFALINKTEPVSPRRIAGVGVGCVAMGMILLPQTTISADILGWIGLAFLVPVSYGIYHNYVASRWPADSDTWQVASGEMIVALLLLAPLFATFGEPAQSPLVNGDAAWRSVYWVIMIMVVFAAMEVFLYFTIIKRAGAVVVSLSNFVTIAAGVIWGMIIFGERPGLWSWVSVAVLMIALALVIERQPPGQRAGLESR